MFYRNKIRLAIATAVGFITVPVLMARALPSFPHSTVQASADFGSTDIPAIPADFFGPGSDPFVGTLNLTGSGGVDTRIMPQDPPVTPGDPIPVEVVTLQLSGSMTVTYNGGQTPESWDVVLGLSKAKPIKGVITPTLDHSNGGTFNATVIVQPRFTFVRVSDQMQLSWDMGQDIQKVTIQLEFTGVPFVVTVNPALGVDAPYDGVFVPGVRELTPGDPLTQEIQSATGVTQGGGVIHIIQPALAAAGCTQLQCYSLCLECSETDAACTTPVTGDLSIIEAETNFLPVHLALVQAGKADPNGHAALKTVQEILAKQNPPPKAIVKIVNVQDAINAIKADYIAQGPQHVVIFGHGSPGHFKIGEDVLELKTGKGRLLVDKFVTALKGQIKALTLVGCEVAKGAQGQAFLKELTTKLQRPVHAWESKIYVFGHDPEIPTEWVNTFAIESNTDKKEIPAVTEWGMVVMLLLVLTAGTLVVMRRRPVTA